MKSRKPPFLQHQDSKSLPVHHKPDLRKLDLNKLTNLIFQNHIITRTLPKPYGQNRPHNITYPDLTNAGFH